MNKFSCAKEVYKIAIIRWSIVRVSLSVAGWTVLRSLFRLGFISALWVPFATGRVVGVPSLSPCPSFGVFFGIALSPSSLATKSWASPRALSPRCLGGVGGPVCVSPGRFGSDSSCYAGPRASLCPRLCRSRPDREGGRFAFGTRPAWVFFHRRARSFPLLLLADSQGA